VAARPDLTAAGGYPVQQVRDVEVEDERVGEMDRLAALGRRVLGVRGIPQSQQVQRQRRQRLRAGLSQKNQATSRR
jgi:hypothetical protein